MADQSQLPDGDSHPGLLIRVFHAQERPAMERVRPFEELDFKLLKADTAGIQISLPSVSDSSYYLMLSFYLDMILFLTVSSKFCKFCGFISL